jgi:transposase
MSLPKFDTQGSLFESLGSLAAQLFSDQDRYKLFATKIWPLIAKSREELAVCYVLDNGRPGVEPVILLGVLIFQFLERVPDRQAAELVKYHLGWKLALNLDLNFKGIHHTTLSYFRERLLAKGKADLAMRTIIEGLQAAGLVKQRAKQRLDSTHIVGAVARLSALECVRETLALALEELKPRLKAERLPDFWALLWERYVESKLDYKSNEETLRAKLAQAGEDCLGLLQWLEPLPVELREGKQVALLREVFAQQYVVEGPGKVAPVKVHATGVVQNPHDPEAEWSAKGRGKHKKEWVGYKVQVAESLPQAEGQIGFITSVVTQRASESDDPGLELTLNKQEQLGLERPSEMYVDGAYISANAITQARQEGWHLMGPAQPSPAAPKQPELYRIEAFDVSITERRAVCPQGKISTECSKITEGDSGKVTYRFEFGRQCRNCPVKALCVPKSQPHRMIRVGALHEALQQRRREQQTPAFKLRMQQRNGIEGTISELVRGHGLRRARYRGFRKVDLQNQLIAAACNIKRWLGKLIILASQPGKECHSLIYWLLTSLRTLVIPVLSRISMGVTIFDAPNLVFA